MLRFWFSGECFHGTKSSTNLGDMNNTHATASAPRTLAEKIWDDHVIVRGENGQPDLIYIDLHLVHEVTSPQAFDGL